MRYLFTADLPFGQYFRQHRIVNLFDDYTLICIYIAELVVLELNSILLIFYSHISQARCWVAWTECLLKFFSFRWYGPYGTFIRWYYTPKLHHMCFILMVFKGLGCAWTSITCFSYRVGKPNHKILFNRITVKVYWVCPQSSVKMV